MVEPEELQQLQNAAAGDDGRGGGGRGGGERGGATEIERARLELASHSFVAEVGASRYYCYRY